MVVRDNPVRSRTVRRRMILSGLGIQQFHRLAGGEAPLHPTVGCHLVGRKSAADPGLRARAAACVHWRSAASKRVRGAAEKKFSHAVPTKAERCSPITKKGQFLADSGAAMCS